MSLTIILIVITVITSYLAFSNPDIMKRWIMNPYLTFEKKQFYRFITSGFIHANWMHLGFNMFTLYFFGRTVDYFFTMRLGGYGTLVFLGFYLTAIIVSDLPVAWKYRHVPGYSSLGASGGVSAMVFASILYQPLADLCLFGIICLPGFILGILYIIYSYYQGKNAQDGINHEAHLYGAIYGLVIGLLVYPPAGKAFFQQIFQYSPF